jgi:hypothetical protein
MTCKSALVLSIVAMIAATPAFAQTDASAKAHELLAARHLDGAIVMQDVRTGTTIASAEIGDKWEDGVLPLSTTKLFLAALSRERGVRTSVDVPQLIAQGSDADGRTLALDLRHAAGSETILADLAHFGFPACSAHQTVNCFALSPQTSDADWASTLSIGEYRIRVTLERLSDFLGIIGRSGTDLHNRILHIATAHEMQVAMRDAVMNGTAKGIKDRLPIGFAIGGKTGTGPEGAQPGDGIFAGLVFDARARARYTVAVYVRGGGPGGGAAAEIAADLSAFVIANRMGDTPDGK